MSKFKFDKIENIANTPDMRVLIISGSHTIFIDKIVADIKKNISSNSEQFAVGVQEDSEFNTIDEKESTLDFDTFIKVCNSLSPMGKWLCKVNYDFINKKDKERIKAYIKKPSEHAMLIVTVSEFKNIREVRSIRTLDNSKYSHLIDIQYPRRVQLESIVKQMFLDKGARIEEQSAKLFILKLGTAYDEYKPNIEKVCDRLNISKNDSNNDEKKITENEKHTDTDVDVRIKSTEVGFKDFNEAMKGIDYFVIDDFILQLLVPIHNKKVVKRRRIYKILDTLLYDFTPKEICNKLKIKVEELLQYRAYINKGFIPVRTRYNAEKIKERLPEDSKLRKASSLTFKRNAYTASLTSIADWYYIYSMLCRNKPSDSEDKHMNTLLAIMGRTAISNDRLMNDIMVKNTLDEGLYNINSMFYTNMWKDNKQNIISIADASDIDNNN